MHYNNIRWNTIELTNALLNKKYLNSNSNEIILKLNKMREFIDLDSNKYFVKDILTFNPSINEISLKLELFLDNQNSEIKCDKISLFLDYFITTDQENNDIDILIFQIKI